MASVDVLDSAVQVQAFASVNVMCAWARHFTITALLSILVYKWVPLILIFDGDKPVMN